MRVYTYSNDYETYEIFKLGDEWIVSQDGIFADRRFKTLKEAKREIDNQNIWF